MVINYNELLPVLLIGFICGVVSCIDTYKNHLKESEQDEEKSIHLLVVDLLKNTIYTTFLSCFIFWVTLLATDNYQIRLGIVGIISILGLDKALGVVERIRGVR